MNTIYRLYLIFGAILAILLTMHMFINVYAEEPKSVFRQAYPHLFKDTPAPKKAVTYMDHFEFLDFLDLVTDAAIHNVELPPPPASLNRDQRRLYLRLLRELEKARQQFFPSSKPRVLYTQKKVTSGIIASKPPAAASNYKFVFVVPAPPGWNINKTYIPDYDRLWQLQQQEANLRQAQRPTKSQRFRSTPKGRRFRR